MLKRGIRRAKDSVHRALHSSTPDIAPNSTALSPQAPPLATPYPPSSSPNPPVSNISPAVVSSGPEPVLIAHSTQSRVGQTCFTGLKRLADVLGKAGSEFGPLKSAVDGLSSCIDIFERKSETQKEYERVGAELDTLLSDLSGHLKGPLPPAMTPSIFGLARQVLNANVNTWKTLDELATNDRLERLPKSPAAPYRSAESDSLGRVPCTSNTRTQVLDQLRSWAHTETSEKIYWLNGMAGTGKTTIAYSFCDYLKNISQLGASFFCSRQLPSCRDVNKIVPSISYQLSLFSLPFRHALSRVLENDKEAHNRPLGEQFEQLILAPLREIQYTFPSGVVIVVDALDECDDKDGVARTLDTLLTNVSGFLVKFFVTSRPDEKIVERMRSQEDGVHSELRLHELDHTIVHQDIATYLRTELERAKLSDIDLQRLAERSGVLFIYAATAARYISSGGFSRSAKRLRLVLDATPAVPSSSDRDVDALYTTILQAALESRTLDDSDKEEMMTILHTAICAQEPLSVDTIAEILGLDPSSSVQPALQPLLSVLNISETTGLVITLHESFSDYILNRHRSDRFYCDAREHHSRLAHICFTLIKVPNPPFNICKLESSYVLDEDVPDLDKRADEAISDALYYACRNWSAHLERATVEKGLAGALYEFQSERLLLWMEVLNLKKRLYHGAGMLHKIQGWCRENVECSDELRLLVQDAYKFVVVVSSSPIRHSTPHIYMSALPFWPEYRPIRRTYLPKLVGLVKATGVAMAKREHAPVTIYTGGGEVQCAVYSPGGEQIASASANGTVDIWDAYTGQMIGQQLRSRTTKVSSVSFSPNDSYLASTLWGGTTCTSDLPAGQTVSQALNKHITAATSVAHSPNGAYIVSGSWDYTLRVWDTRTGRTIGHPLEGHAGPIHCIAFSPDSAHVISGSSDCSIRIWNLHTSQMVGQPLQGHTGSICSVAYSPNGSHIVSGSNDKSIRIWDTNLPACGATARRPHKTGLVSQMIGHPLEGHTGAVRSVTYSPDGMHLLSASDDTTIRIWDSHASARVEQSPAGHSASVSAVAWSPDSARIVSGSADGTILIWDSRSYEPLGQLLTGHTEVTSVSYSPDGARIASCSADHTIRVWDAHTGKVVGQIFEAHSRAIYSLAFSPDGSFLVSGSSDRTIRVWDVRTYLEVGQPLKGHTIIVLSVAFSPDGIHIASGSYDKTVRIWKASTGQLVGSPLIGHTDAVRSVAYSSDGAWIVSGSWDETIRIWNAHTRQMRGKPLVGHTQPVLSVACSPDFSFIVSGSLDSTILIWDTNTYQMVGRPLKGHTDWVRSVAYSPDGMYIVSGSGDQTVRIWDAYRAQNQGNSTGRAGVDLGSADDATSVTHTQLSAQHKDLPTPTLQPLALHGHMYDLAFDIWELDEDGWVITDGSKLLAWIPLDLRSCLPRRPNTNILSRHGELRLDFSGAKLGDAWQQCYVHLG